MRAGSESSKLACSVIDFWALSRDGHVRRLLREKEDGTGVVCEHVSESWGSVMAQAITSWFICDGRFRVHAINAVGRRSARIIEIEDVETGERVHGNARRLERLFLSLGSSGFGLSSDTSLSGNQTR
jgi:hypothetical protein